MHSWRKDKPHCLQVAGHSNQGPTNVYIYIYVYRSWTGKHHRTGWCKVLVFLTMVMMTINESCKVSCANKNTWSDCQQLTYTLVYRIHNSIVWHSINAYSNIVDHIQSDMIWPLVWPFVWPFISHSHMYSDLVSSIWRSGARSSGDIGSSNIITP